MAEENISQEFRLKNIDETRNYLIKEIEKKEEVKEDLISKALIDSNISYDKFVLTYNVLKEYDNMKKQKKVLRLKKFIKGFSLFIKQSYCTV